MKRSHLNIILWMVTIMAIMVAIFAVYMTAQKESDLRSLDEVIKQTVAREVSAAIQPSIQPKDGYTPIKNIDYFDGRHGKNATDDQVQKAVDKYMKDNPPQVTHGQDGKNATKEQIEDAVNKWFELHPPLTPQTRCNVTKNRWEVRYGEDQAWQLMNNEKVKCTTE